MMFPLEGQTGYSQLPVIREDYFPLLQRALAEQAGSRPYGDVPQLPVTAESNVGTLGLILQGILHGGKPAGNPRTGYLQSLRN